MVRLSIIIPALNEATTLPPLLDALNHQTCKPDEIIVADAGSKDGTRDLARERGASVVDGGMPAVGRNAGADAAHGDIFLFLDADVLPQPHFIERALDEFVVRECDVATCLIAPLGNNPADLAIAETTNLYLQVVQSFSPHAPGFCIMIKREVHQKIGGFDETVKLAEDHDYVQRAAEVGEFAVMTRARIPVSMRRLEKEGLTQLAFKYLWCEMHALAGKPIYDTPFEYEFGAHEPKAKKRPLALRVLDVADLRDRLGRFQNPILQLKMPHLEQIEKLLKSDRSNRFELQLDPHDLLLLRRYLLRRLALIRVTPPPLKETLARFQTLPIKESLQLLDMNWLRSRLPGKSSDDD